MDKQYPHCSDKTAIRVFFAACPPYRICKQLIHQAEMLQPACGGHHVKIPNIHLTLAFLGNIFLNRIDVLRKIMQTLTAQAFDLTFDEICYWKHHQVIFARPERSPPELLSLVSLLKTALGTTGFGFDNRTYKPHITLIRKTNPVTVTRLNEPVHWYVSEWSLLQSRQIGYGVEYVPLCLQPLEQSSIHNT